jgi:hypothetical protein
MGRWPLRLVVSVGIPVWATSLALATPSRAAPIAISGSRRRTQSKARTMAWRAIAVVVGLGALGGSTPAAAATLPFSGELTIQIDTLPAVAFGGTGIAVVNGSGAPGHLTRLQLAGGTFMTTGFVLTISPPAVGAVAGIRVTASNATANFTAGSATGVLAGKMPIPGVAKICLFFPCGSAPPANLNVPLTVVGNGGSSFIAASVDITVSGAPWTTAGVGVGTLSTAGGFVHGPASGTTSTAAASGVVRLVTPIFISTNVPGFETVPALATLTLHFVPEPATFLLVAAGLALVAVGGRRMMERD